MKLIHDSKPLTSQACSCRKYQNSIYDCSLSYGNRNKSLRLSTRGYIRSQDDERLSALAATRSAPTATAQRKNRIKDEVKVDELSCRAPSCRTPRRYIVGAEISTLYKSQSIRHHESNSAGGWMNWVQKSCCSRWRWYDSESKLKLRGYLEATLGSLVCVKGCWNLVQSAIFGTHGNDYPTCDKRWLSADNIIRFNSGARRPTESGFGILCCSNSDQRTLAGLQRLKIPAVRFQKHPRQMRGFSTALLILLVISLQRSRSVSEMQNTTQNQSKSFRF